MTRIKGYLALLPEWQHITEFEGVYPSKFFFLITEHQGKNKADGRLYLTKSLYWFTWDCIFILERLLAWCQESCLLPFLPWDTTHHCKGSWQLPGCPARSPSSLTTWSWCLSQNHAGSSTSSPFMAHDYPTNWKGAVPAPASHRGGSGGPWGHTFLTHDYFGDVPFFHSNKLAGRMDELWCKVSLLQEC